MSFLYFLNTGNTHCRHNTLTDQNRHTPCVPLTLNNSTRQVCNIQMWYSMFHVHMKAQTLSDCHQVIVIRRTEIRHTSQPSQHIYCVCLNHKHVHWDIHKHTLRHTDTQTYRHTHTVREGGRMKTTGLFSPMYSPALSCHVGSTVPVTLQQQQQLRHGS